MLRFCLADGRVFQQWKPFYLVLRPNLLSLYKASTEERLLKQISLSDLTAVAYLKDPKGRRQNVFGLFSPSRNFRLQAKSEADARAWVELIKQEARVDEEDHQIYPGSPTAVTAHGKQPEHTGHDRWDHERLGSSSPEPPEVPPRHSTTTRDGIRIPGIRRSSAHELEYSGDELAHYSDFSDTPPQSYTQAPAFGSFLKRNQRVTPDHNTPYAPEKRAATARNVSQTSGFQVEQDEERVIWHGYLLCLKTKGGVRQWKRLWVVLRPKNLAFYKNDEVRHWYLSSIAVLTHDAGVCSQPYSSSLKHHQCRGDRSDLTKQIPLHADYRGRKELPVLCVQ